jgi:transcriptional regulator with XRE-family HTH domain
MQIENNFKIGRNIKKLRELRDYTQEYIASQIGKKQTEYSKIERGKKKIEIDDLIKIADILKVRPEDILNFDSERIIFNITESNGVNGVNTTYFYNQTNEITKLIEEQNTIKEDVKHLKFMFEQFLNKN